ncbi:MAG: hypothetical protein JSW73_02375 [Candidatus Woesearchaeota archaeon]|nr:MAG: hypothetical protein JSW73_02375 [Candidatus Woesearchaeota archaeon]
MIKNGGELSDVINDIWLDGCKTVKEGQELVDNTPPELYNIAIDIQNAVVKTKLKDMSGKAGYESVKVGVWAVKFGGSPKRNITKMLKDGYVQGRMLKLTEYIRAIIYNESLPKNEQLTNEQLFEIEKEVLLSLK